MANQKFSPNGDDDDAEGVAVNSHNHRADGEQSFGTAEDDDDGDDEEEGE